MGKKRGSSAHLTMNDRPSPHTTTPSRAALHRHFDYILSKGGVFFFFYYLSLQSTRLSRIGFDYLARYPTHLNRFGDIARIRMHVWLLDWFLRGIFVDVLPSPRRGVRIDCLRRFSSSDFIFFPLWDGGVVRWWMIWIGELGTSWREANLLSSIPFYYFAYYLSLCFPFHSILSINSNLPVPPLGKQTKARVPQTFAPQLPRRDIAYPSALVGRGLTSLHPLTG